MKSWEGSSSSQKGLIGEQVPWPQHLLHLGNQLRNNCKAYDLGRCRTGVIKTSEEYRGFQPVTDHNRPGIATKRIEPWCAEELNQARSTKSISHTYDTPTDISPRLLDVSCAL